MEQAGPGGGAAAGTSGAATGASGAVTGASGAPAGEGAAAGGTSPRQPRRGPAPFASFDHDVSDESSPESKLTFQLPEIREDLSPSSAYGPGAVGRARSASTPAVGALQPAPRIDISRASSSSHHDSRDSSPEMALFAGTGGDESRAHLELAFREDGALDLRSSTEELAFLEGSDPAPPPPARPAAPAPDARRHSRKDSQGSEAALLGVGRTSRLSSVGSQCSAYSHTSRVSRLSVVSGMSRSPSPHKMLLETSFCGPKPIENDPEICAAAVEECMLEIAKLSAELPAEKPPHDVRAEVTVETRPAPRPATAPAIVPVPVIAPEAPIIAVQPTTDEDKLVKETRNRARAEERRARSRERRDDSYDKPEVFRSKNKNKNIIRIKLRPDDEDDEEEEEVVSVKEDTSVAIKPVSLELRAEGRGRESRTPSPAPGQVSRKSSFCSLFKSKETIASPESPAGALRRKKSLNEGRSRSKSRDRSATRGSVMSLFRTPRRSAAPSPAPSSRAASPPIPPAVPPRADAAHLKYYEDTSDGVIHIPLRTPPDEQPGGSGISAVTTTTTASVPSTNGAITTKPLTRTVLPDGSIIIPLHSPTEKTVPTIVSADIETVPTKSPPAVTSVTIPMAETPKLEKRKEIECVEKEAVILDSTSDSEAGRARRERLVFTTHVGSRDQVFSTQFSITKTPSVTSEMSAAFPSISSELSGGAETQILRDTHIATVEPPPRSPLVLSPSPSASIGRRDPSLDSVTVQPRLEEMRVDSSESEPSSEAGGGRRGPISDLLSAGGSEDAEKRGLVLGQESFEEELPYVPTTLPLERSVALPMVPVRDRGGVSVARVERPRPCAPTPSGPPRAPHPAVATPPADKIKISLPRRPRAASASAPPKAERARTRSGSGAGWIDFEEVPEKRKQPKRIQTLPAAATAADVVYSYVEPEHCRCECHATAVRRDDEQPLLRDPSHPDATSPQSPECSGSHVTMSVHIARPFTADLDLHHDQPVFDAEASGSSRRH
ncbi:serine/arginine repetitive matrix protein 1 isoform X2 [Plutella xylostella]|uniref:serine/arginine repetitive matrix protein 1 isoform X2 n=1 Tax=Plutella xylostella TaxID=51655 RepID=UPI002032B201|nr:serine/arginine repetitive matrix protein 1 isoform X2 [Plutella xylostella]